MTSQDPFLSFMSRSRPGLLAGALLVALLYGVSLLFLLRPDLDLRFSRLFFTPETGFALAQMPWAKAFRRLNEVAVGAMMAMALAALAVPFLPRMARWTLRPRDGVFLLAVYALGPGLIVNEVFKNRLFGRPRPYQIVDFGGTMPFADIWAMGGACRSNCSFVSGEAASVAAVLALAFVLPRGFRAGFALAAGLLTAALSLNRIAFGGHFLSDVLLAWILMAILIVALHAAMRGPAGAAIDRRFARLAGLREHGPEIDSP